MEILARARAAGHPVDLGALVAAIPYCSHLGISARIEKERLTLHLPFTQCLIGNPILPALHGGVIGSLLETAAIAQVLFETGASVLPKPVDITIDYLRAGRARDSYARARIGRQGKRVVNVLAEMWQEDESRPIAALRGHMLIEPSQT